MASHSYSTDKLIEYERAVTPLDCSIVAGIDEAGRGPLAGPVVAAAVILPIGIKIEGVYDSKALTASQRERVFREIVSVAVDIGIGLADHDLIDQINIRQATIVAMCAALDNLLVRPDCVLIDALSIPARDEVVQKGIVKGDQKCYSIAAASILAKVIRDRLMGRLHLRYPAYNFVRNKGYGTREHLEAIAKVGPSPLHRKTFRGVKEFCPEEDNPLAKKGNV